MTDGPISTPRRPAPRSIGTPMIFTFLNMTRTSVRPRSGGPTTIILTSWMGGRQERPRPAELNLGSQTADQLWRGQINCEAVSTLDRISHPFHKSSYSQFEFVQIRRFNNISLGPGNGPPFSLEVTGSGRS